MGGPHYNQPQLKQRPPVCCVALTRPSELRRTSLSPHTASWKGRNTTKGNVRTIGDGRGQSSLITTTVCLLGAPTLAQPMLSYTHAYLELYEHKQRKFQSCRQWERARQPHKPVCLLAAFRPKQLTHRHMTSWSCTKMTEGNAGAIGDVRGQNWPCNHACIPH